MFDLFENLCERAEVDASVLSGGEQQMLTMCRTLMGDPGSVMIDEPTEGLSPADDQRVAEFLQEIARRGVCHFPGRTEARDRHEDHAHRVYVMGHGHVVFEGTPETWRPATMSARNGWRYRCDGYYAKSMRPENRIGPALHPRLESGSAPKTKGRPMTMTLDPVRLNRIKSWSQRYVEERKFPGTSVLIRQHGEEAFFDAQGEQCIDSGKLFTRKTVARIYSMTKPITSLALMMLVEEGVLHLDAPLSRFLPEFGDSRALVQGATSIKQTESCATPTLHQLLTHRSGMSYPFNIGILPDAMADIDLLFKPRAGTLAQQCNALAQLPLAFKPGIKWEYSVGIDVVGRVIEVVSGQSLAAFFQEHIFAPLGMTETGFSVPLTAKNRFAALYSPLAGDAMDLNAAQKSEESLRFVDGVDRSPFLDATCFSGGGGLVGTIDDYMRFAECLRMRGQGLVSPSTAEFMMSNHLPGDIASFGPSSFAEQPMDGVGFGIGGAVVIDPAQSRIPSSTGDFSWGGMASTFFWIDRVHDISVVFFTQLSPSSSYPSRAELKALVHGALM